MTRPAAIPNRSRRARTANDRLREQIVLGNGTRAVDHPFVHHGSDDGRGCETSGDCTLVKAPLVGQVFRVDAELLVQPAPNGDHLG